MEIDDIISYHDLGSGRRGDLVSGSDRNELS
jgi:hypothetical protein